MPMLFTSRSRYIATFSAGWLAFLKPSSQERESKEILKSVREKSRGGKRSSGRRELFTSCSETVSLSITKKVEAGAAAYFYGAWKRKRRGTEKRRRNLRMVGRKADWIQWTILTCQVILTVRRERRGEIYLLENIPPRTKNSWGRGGKREIGGKGGGSSRYNTLSKITFQSRSGQLESFL